jgi:hypothetical protein
MFDMHVQQHQQQKLDVLKLIKCRVSLVNDGPESMYYIIIPKPLKGALFITRENTEFISGQVRVRGRGGGRYPFHLLEAIDHVFGVEYNAIEVCSGKVTGLLDGITTVDLNPKNNPTIVDDAEWLGEIRSDTYDRWRADPPYNHDTAKNMYGTELPSPIKLLKAGARVCKSGSLLFLLLGPVNYQWHPAGIKRIGCIVLTVVPNNEIRCLNIYYKM